MEDEAIPEVLYETRRHASGPFFSNYPPQLPKGNEKGFFTSLFSARGLNQIKERWNGKKDPTKGKKPVSLFISPGGQRVAVATRNQITILRKEDDYQEPCGFFTSDSLSTLTCGVWSDSYDVLGVVDDADTFYIIKSNGEEKTRITKKELKFSLPIIGLIPQEDTDGKESLVCSFIIVTKNGQLHHIGIGLEPTASVSSMHVSNGSLISKGQFPEDVFCFDYDSKHSLLVLVGIAVSSSGNSGCCHLSLWRRHQNLDLEPLFSIQFEGLYCKTKDNVVQLACPKVLISPQANFVATIDLTGCLHIFKLDMENCLFTSISGGERSDSLGTNNVLDRQNELLSNIVDFTWWSDHIVALAKSGGIFTMVDILTGLKLQDNDPVYSMPILGRVQHFQGHIFLLECKSSEEINIPSNDNRKSDALYRVDQITEVQRDSFDVSRLHWTLVSISQRSVSEMYSILISDQKYEAALDFANRHGMDRDEVLKSQWLHSCQGENEINLFLSNIKDRGFVLSECLDKVGPTEDAAKALLACGLCDTDQFRLSEIKDHECSQVWELRMARLQLLQFKDRLETYLGINMGRFSVQEYCKFRVIPLNETAVALAESGKIGALNLLFKRHPYSLSPSILQILGALPETVPVQTYGQLLPGRAPPTSIALREEDWVECEQMVTYISKLPENHEMGILIRTEYIVKRCLGYLWPSIDELSIWYKNRARDIDCYSGQLDNCLTLIDFACRKGIYELQKFHEDILFLHQLIYSDESDGEIIFNMKLATWEQLSDYEKFRIMLKEIKEEIVVNRLHDKAIPFMQKRFYDRTSVNSDQVTDGHSSLDQKDESFLVRWLKEIALENRIDICLMVIEEGCKDLHGNNFFKDETEAVDCALQCIYLSTLTDRWNTMSTILSKLPQKQGAEICTKGLEKRLKRAEGHIEAGRLLAFYQVPKPLNFFLEAHADEKGVKQILRLILSKFVRRQPSRSDNDWANMWRDMQCLREKAFPYVDPEYMLIEFCRGLLKAGKFSLARNYLKGTSSVALASEKAENLVIQAAREFFFSASSLSCSEIWKAKECLNLFPSSRNVNAEADIINALTVKLPNLGVSLLPMQFRQIKDPMEIVKMAITSQAGAYLHVDELIEVAKLLGLSSLDDISAVEEAIAREAAVAGDLQLAFDLCLVLAKKGHGLIWDLCAAIARGPALENMDVKSRKQLLGFALSHCDEESIGELLHAWKELDMQDQLETVVTLTGSSSPNFATQHSPRVSLPAPGIQDMCDLKNFSELMEGVNGTNQEAYFTHLKNTLLFVAKNFPVDSGPDLDSLLSENGKILSFVAFQLPWLLELSEKAKYGKNLTSDIISQKQCMNIRTKAVITILSWLARNGFVPKDNVIASLAKSIMEPPVTEEEDIMGCTFLLNLMDAFSGLEVIEDQLKLRENYQEICSIMNVGMTYSSVHNVGVECKGPTQKRELLLKKFKEKKASISSDEINNIDEVQSTFWREWKLKLEEKKRVAEQSRVLEQIIPGVDTTRFLSGDSNYIETAVFSLIESVKLEKKHIIKDVLKLVDTYGLNRIEVLQHYLTLILVSEVWTDDDILAEISEVKGELVGYASETIKTLSLVIYPAIDGCNKQRLAYIFGLLSDCCFQLKEVETVLPIIHPSSSQMSSLDFGHWYKLIEQECRRVSFIKNLNFKNIAGLDGLNLESFNSEIFLHVDEFSLEALAKMVQTLLSVFADSVPKGLLSWQDVYKHYVLSLLTALENRTRTEFKVGNPEKFQDCINHLEQSYDFCRSYVRILAPSDALDIMKHYFTAIIPLHGSYEIIPDNSAWQDCLIIILNFWLRLTEGMQEIISNEGAVDELRFDPECLSSCLKVFMKLVMEDSVSPSQGWGSIIGYGSFGLTGDFSVELLIFCRAMVFSGCGFGAISEVFSEAISHFPIGSTPTAGGDSPDLPHLYLNILEPILRDWADGSKELQNLYHLLSSLSKLEGQIENLQRVRCAVWERMVQFSHNLQLPSHVRVRALELMQFITDRNINGFSVELQSNVLPWEGWDESLIATKKSGAIENYDYTDTSSKFTSTLVALKSSQIAALISPGNEINPDDLLDVKTAVSRFSKLCEASSTNPHVDALIAILEEWEGFFVTGRAQVDSAEEASKAGNDWNNEDWDEGWESFQEDSLEKQKMENSLIIHPLHVCWLEIFKKLIMFSRFDNVRGLIDRSLSKANGALLDEDDARSLNQALLEVDCFVALKVALLLPYEGIQFQCLRAIEDKLKHGGAPDTLGRDHEFLLLVLSSGVISTILTNSSYGTTFSYLCYLVGNFSRQCQEARLIRLAQRRKNECVDTEKDSSFLFSKILLPCFISELVKADQQILAGVLITKFMHSNASLSLINITEASLSRYLKTQLHSLQHMELAPEETRSCEILKNTISRLQGKLENLIQSALGLLSTNFR